MSGTSRDRGGTISGLALALLAARPSAQAVEPPALQSAFAISVEKKMRAHPYLARTSFDPVESRPPYLIFVQRSSEPGARAASQVAADAAALLEPARERFGREIQKPLGLTQRSDVPQLAVIVLRSADAFEECYRATPGAWHFDARAATFARDVGAAVLYDEPAGARDPLERARSAQHVLVHVLQSATYPLADPAPVRSWLFEGMADYLARPEGGDALPGAERLADFVSDAKTPESRWAHLRTFEEMCSVDEPLHLEEFFQTRTPDSSLMPGSDQDPWTAFYREATLLYAFLASGDDGQHRPGLQKFIEQAFAGRRRPEVLAASFAPVKPDELEKQLLAWVQREHKRAFPGDKVKPELVLGALARADMGALASAEPAARAPAKETAAGTTRAPTAPAASAPATRTAPVRALSPLTLADATPEERLAWAIQEIGSGRLRSGRARLAELMAGGEGPLAERVAREDRRAAAWEAARDAFLQRLVADRSVIGLDLGPRVPIKEFGVRSYSEGLVELDDRKGGIRRVPVDALDPLALAREMRSGPPQDDWTRLYVFVLRGNEQWKKLLKPDGEEEKTLLADAREDYPARLALGRAMTTLASVADRPLPSTPKEADQRTALFKSLLVELTDTSVVERKRSDLRAHLQALFERRFELQSPATWIAGKLEALGSERVRITYAFDDPHELDDFEAKPYPMLASRELGNTKAANVPFQVSHGALVALGQASLRSLYDLEAPITVRYDVGFEDVVDGMIYYFALGICDDGAEHFVWAVNLKSLELFEQVGSSASPDLVSAIPRDRPSQLELRHDGQTVRLLCDGKQQSQLDAGARQYGAIFLRTSTEMQFSMQKLVVEGRLRPDGFERMKRAWAQRQMVGL